MLYYELRVDYRVLYCRTVVVVEIQQVENRVVSGFCKGTAGTHYTLATGPTYGNPPTYHSTKEPEKDGSSNRLKVAIGDILGTKQLFILKLSRWRTPERVNVKGHAQREEMCLTR